MNYKIIRLSFLMFLMFNVTQSFSQFGMLEGRRDILDPKGKTLIAIVNEDLAKGFNAEVLKNALTATWKLTPFKVVSQKEVQNNIDEYKGNSNYYFLTFAEKSAVGLSNVYLFLSNEINKKGEQSLLKTKTTIALCPILFMRDKDFSAELTLTMLQKFVGIDGRQVEELLNPDPSIIDKTLMIDDRYLHKKTEADIKKIYDSDFRLVNFNNLTKDEILNNKGVYYMTAVSGIPKEETAFYYVFDPIEKKFLFIHRLKGYGNYYHVNIDQLNRLLKKNLKK